MSEGAEPSATTWFLRGMRGVISVPALILLSSMVGFGVLTREAGLSLAQATFMTAAIWALPSQVVLVGSITSGASLLSTALAVSLSAVRFTPMIAAWVTQIRSADTPRWKLLLLSHFVAVTSWVFAALRLPGLPEEARMPFFTGFAVTLTSLAVCATAGSFLLAGALPPMLAGALFFLTPIYFLTALTATARLLGERLALAAGLIIGPALQSAGVPLALVWAGLIGGTLAFVAGRLVKAR